MTETLTSPELYEDLTDLLHQPAKLRARAQEEGLLFFRGLLPKEDVLEVRRDILQVCRDQGWLKPGAAGEEGVCDLNTVNQIPTEQIVSGAGIPHPIYAEVQKLESFHRIAHHPNLLTLYRALFGTEVFVHPRNIARIILPHKDVAPTPAHQDFIHVQGAMNTWTCWFPLGNCSRALGGLTVLKGSHQQGVRHITKALGAGNAESQICGNEREWVQGDFLAGDLVTFPSLTVHKALPNQYNDRLRLSCDFRYQPANEPVEEKSLLPHISTITWEEIYAGWKDDRLKYYWKSQHPPLSPWDESVRWQKQRIC
jgi:hypothetical protein